MMVKWRVCKPAGNDHPCAEDAEVVEPGDDALKLHPFTRRSAGDFLLPDVVQKGVLEICARSPAIEVASPAHRRRSWLWGRLNMIVRFRAVGDRLFYYRANRSVRQGGRNGSTPSEHIFPWMAFEFFPQAVERPFSATVKPARP